MRRLLAVAVVIGLVGGAALPAAGAKKKKRKRSSVERVTRKDGAFYEFSANVTGHGTTYVLGYRAGGAVFPTRRNESFVRVTVADDHLDPVKVDVGQDVDDDGTADVIASFCSKSDRPIPIVPGDDVTVWVMQGSCADGTRAIATRGRIDVVFTNIP